MRNASCQWSPQPGASSGCASDEEDNEDITKEAILGLKNAAWWIGPARTWLRN